MGAVPFALGAAVNSFPSVVNSRPEFEPAIGTEGLGVGIRGIDSVTNGFFGGQLVAVYGPESRFVHAFLIQTFLFGTLHCSKHIDYVYSSGSLRQWDESLARFVGLQSEAEFWNHLQSQRISRVARIRDIDLGDPKNVDWKKYRDQVSTDVPDCILIDGAEDIELFLKERNMAQQLKALAGTLNVPVIASAPRKNRITEDGMMSAALRKDYLHTADVLIRISPTSGVPYFVKNIQTGNRYVLEMLLSSSDCPCSRCRGYLTECAVEFTEHDFRFNTL